MFSPTDMGELRTALATVQRLQREARNLRDVAPVRSTERAFARSVAVNLQQAERGIDWALADIDEREPQGYSEDQIDEGLRA